MIITNFFIRRLIYRFIGGIFQTIDLAMIHPVREMTKIALNESVAYASKSMTSAIGLQMGQDVIEFALRQISTPGHFLEFGVYKGDSIRFIAKRIGKKTIHGFDSFLGLPENWSGFKMDKTTLDLQGKLPKVPVNVHLHRGWFDETIPQWLERNEGSIAFIHIDCDIYSSTKTIFDLTAHRFHEGTVIVFDEYFNYPNWQQHEFRAFQEFVSQKGVKYEYLAYARQQVAVRILSSG